MGSIWRIRTFSKNAQRGFSIIEILVALFVLGLASAGVAALFGQLSLVSKRSTQSGTLMEMRAKVNGLNQNYEKWLNKMRARFPIYAACIPDANTATSVGNKFECPQASDAYQDKGLKEISASQLWYTKAPILDLMGDLIAGGETPLYLDDSGRPCEGENQVLRCPLMSTGYMLRSNSATNANPGDIRFVVKIEKNMAAQNAGAAIKPVYLTVEIGRSWEEGSGIKDKTIKIGYLNDGNPMVVDPEHKCPDGKFYVGSDEKGAAICKSFPNCTGGSGAALTSVDNELVCTNTSPCGEGKVHMGYYSGTGKAICTAPSPSCPKDTVQTGVLDSGAAECKALAVCDASEVISFNGQSFGCVKNVTSKSCPAGQTLLGFNSDGSAKCEEQQAQSCPLGQYSAGVDGSGKVVCKQLFANSDDGLSANCGAGEYVAGLFMTDQGLSPECAPLPGDPQTQTAPIAYMYYARGPGGAQRLFKTQREACAYLRKYDAQNISRAECTTDYPHYVSKGKCGQDYWIKCANRK